VLMQHPGLAVVPTITSEVVLAGRMQCRAVGKGGVEVDENYAVEVRIGRQFPNDIPVVFETGGRIPLSFHRNPDESLCLGAPTALRLALSQSPTVGGFIDSVLVPYLYGHAYHARFGVMPYGELPHGRAGLAQHFRTYFRMPAATNIPALLSLTGLRRRVANKCPCPCGSRRRLGRCHHREVNRARAVLGREWFRTQVPLVGGAQET